LLSPGLEKFPVGVLAFPVLALDLLFQSDILVVQMELVLGGFGVQFPGVVVEVVLDVETDLLVEIFHEPLLIFEILDQVEVGLLHFGYGVAHAQVVEFGGGSVWHLLVGLRVVFGLLLQQVVGLIHLIFFLAWLVLHLAPWPVLGFLSEVAPFWVLMCVGGLLGERLLVDVPGGILGWVVWVVGVGMGVWVVGLCSYCGLE